MGRLTEHLKGIAHAALHPFLAPSDPFWLWLLDVKALQANHKSELLQKVVAWYEVDTSRHEEELG